MFATRLLFVMRQPTITMMVGYDQGGTHIRYSLPPSKEDAWRLLMAP